MSVRTAVRWVEGIESVLHELNSDLYRLKDVDMSDAIDELARAYHHIRIARRHTVDAVFTQEDSYHE